MAKPQRRARFFERAKKLKDVLAGPAAIGANATPS
jgi:hypothetical protein